MGVQTRLGERLRWSCGNWRCDWQKRRPERPKFAVKSTIRRSRMHTGRNCRRCWKRTVYEKRRRSFKGD